MSENVRIFKWFDQNMHPEWPWWIKCKGNIFLLGNNIFLLFPEKVVENLCWYFYSKQKAKLPSRKPSTFELFQINFELIYPKAAKLKKLKIGLSRECLNACTFQQKKKV